MIVAYWVHLFALWQFWVKKNPLNSCALRHDLMIYILIVVKITDTFSIQVGIFGSPSKIELLLLLILAVAKVEILA